MRFILDPDPLQYEATLEGCKRMQRSRLITRHTGMKGTGTFR